MRPVVGSEPGTSDEGVLIRPDRARPENGCESGREDCGRFGETPAVNQLVLGLCPIRRPELDYPNYQGIVVNSRGQERDAQILAFVRVPSRFAANRDGCRGLSSTQDNPPKRQESSPLRQKATWNSRSLSVGMALIRWAVIAGPVFGTGSLTCRAEKKQ